MSHFRPWLNLPLHERERVRTMLEALSSSAPADDISSATPLQEGVASVLGHRMAYVAGGSGEPVVFLHGLGQSSGTWAAILPSLARRFRVFAVDMLGCGRSDKPRIDYSLWALATYTRYFMDAVGIERAHLVGHSLGGGVAMHAALQYPERVNRLALMATGGLGRDLRLLLRIATLPGASLALASLTSPAWLRFLESVKLAKLTTPLDIENFQMWARMGQADNRRAFIRMLRSVCNVTGQTVSALERLALMKQPVLLVWGDRDKTIPSTHAHRAAGLIQDCQLAILPGCEHFPSLEQPEVVAPLLEQFLLAEAGLMSAPEMASELERADHREMLMNKSSELAAGMA